jgi:hypothetical protein
MTGLSLSPELLFFLAHAAGHATDGLCPLLSGASRNAIAALRRPSFIGPRRRCTRRSAALGTDIAANSSSARRRPRVKNP